MARVFLNNNAINQKGTPLLYTDILSNRPQYGINGRLFFSTDSQQIFEDTGTSWLLLADATGSVSGYVPYVGATNNVNLGPNTLQSGKFSSIDGNANTFQAIIQNNNLGFNSSTNLALGNDLSTNIGGLSVFSSIFTTGSTGPSALYKADGTYIYSNLEGGLTINSEYPTASLFFATNNTVALTINSSQGATFVDSVTATSFKSSTFTTGSVLFVGTTNNINQDNTNFFWDDTNNRLGIQTNSPGAPLDIHNTVANTTTIQINNTASSNAYIAFQKNSTGYWRIGNTASANTFDLLNNATSTTALSFNNTTNAATFNNSITASSLIKSGGTSSQILAADGSVITAGSNIIISGGTISSTSGGTTTNALTLNNSGTGAASGSTFNGSAAITLSYNTIGAQQALTLTTTGTSGAATLISGTLNIPNYAPDLSGYVTLATTQTLTGFKTFNPSVTASGAIARGGYYTPTLTAAANSDVLVGLDINPTFSNGAFTGVTNYGFRSQAASNIISSNYNGQTGLTISNTTSGTSSRATITLAYNLSSNYSLIAKNSSTTTAYKTLNINDTYWYNTGAGNICFLNDNSTGNINFSAGGSTSPHATLFSTGNLAIGSTTDNGKKLQVNGTTTTVGFADRKSVV